MLLVGILMYVLWARAGHYHTDDFAGRIIGVAVLLILFICKLLTPRVSFTSGSSDGIFSPPLFMGAILGAIFASIVLSVAPVGRIS